MDKSDDVYEIATGGIYTEIHFRIDHFIGPLLENKPYIGQVLDIAIPGGTIMTSSGEVHHHGGWKSDYEHPMIPHQRYLIQLLPHSPGIFYTALDYWNLTTGTVTATLPRNILAAREGKSKLAGMRENDAISYLLNSFANK